MLALFLSLLVSGAGLAATSPSDSIRFPGTELLADPSFTGGLNAETPCSKEAPPSTCDAQATYPLGNAYHPEGGAPAWKLTQRDSVSALGEARHASEGGTGYVTPAKRVVFFRDGTLRLGVNGAVEFGGQYREEEPKQFTLTQNIDPGVAALGTLDRLTLRADVRKIKESQNKGAGYNKAKHGVQFFFRVDIAKTLAEPSATAAGEPSLTVYLPAFDDREEHPSAGLTGTALLPGTLLLPYRELASKSLHEGDWVHLEVGLLPAVRKALAARAPGDSAAEGYHVSAVHFGYLLSGLNAVTMDIKNVSLRAEGAGGAAASSAEMASEEEVLAEREKTAGKDSAGKRNASGASSYPGAAKAGAGAKGAPKATAAAAAEPPAEKNAAKGFFSVGGKGTVYFADGNGEYCNYTSSASFLKAGGRADRSNVRDGSGEPPGVYTGPCDLSEDMQAILDRLYRRYLDEANSNGAEHLPNSQAKDGSWPDVDYADRDADWKPILHLRRVRSMMTAYRTPGAPGFESPVLLTAVERGLRFWFDRKPECDNWFANEIAQQLELQPILVFGRGALTQKTIKRTAGALIAPLEVKPKFPTGQNLVWFAEEQLVRGLILGNDRDVAAASAHLQSALVRRTKLSEPMTNKRRQWTAGQGLQLDGSWFQHGPLLYNGGYGLGALSDGVKWALLLKDTAYAFTPEILNDMVFYVLGGSGLMVRGKLFDYGARGRYLSRPGSNNASAPLARAAESLAELRPGDAKALRALARHIDGEGEKYAAIGHKHFWIGDFAVQQRKEYYTSVHMVSRRTKGTERMKGENDKGFWTSYGLNLITHDGSEYLGLPPMWDWTHLPGVTSPETIPVADTFTQAEAFVGGVSDRKVGVAAMKFEVPPEGGATLRGQKAWFFFDDEFVALGAGIAAEDPGPINTTMNQTKWIGAVTADGKAVGAGTKALRRASWVYHDGMGYFFPGGRDVTVQTESRTGAWNDINRFKSKEKFTEKVFTLWVTHGVKPKAAEYAYVVLPHTNAKLLAAYAKKPRVEILTNSEKLQAVRQPGRGIVQAVFYEPGSLSLGAGAKLTVDQACIVLVREREDKAYVVSVASPVASAVNLRLSLPGSEAAVTYNLPDGTRLGTSIAKELTLTPSPSLEDIEPRGFFRLQNKKTVYLSNGKGLACSFANPEGFFRAGGARDWSNVRVTRTKMPSGKVLGTCPDPLPAGF